MYNNNNALDNNIRNPVSPSIMQPKLESMQFQQQQQQQPQQQYHPQQQQQQQQQYHNQNSYYQQHQQYNHQLQQHLQHQQQINGSLNSNHHQQQPQIYNQINRVCASCMSPINDQIVMECSNRFYHYQCLRCSLCKRNLSENERCYMRDDSIMCKDDYVKYVN
jgi:hypothetical protein